MARKNFHETQLELARKYYRTGEFYEAAYCVELFEIVTNENSRLYSKFTEVTERVLSAAYGKALEDALRHLKSNERADALYYLDLARRFGEKIGQKAPRNLSSLQSGGAGRAIDALVERLK